jgi:hypothetical protein
VSVDPCSQHGCARPATHRVYWPGRELLMCEQHEEKARSVADAMGFDVSSTEITVDLSAGKAVP